MNNFNNLITDNNKYKIKIQLHKSKKVNKIIYNKINFKNQRKRIINKKMKMKELKHKRNHKNEKILQHNSYLINFECLYRILF